MHLLSHRTPHGSRDRGIVEMRFSTDFAPYWRCHEGAVECSMRFPYSTTDFEIVAEVALAYSSKMTNIKITACATCLY